MTAIDESELTATLDAIDRDGYVVLEDAIEPPLVSGLRDTIRRLQTELDVPVGASSFEGQHTRRIYNLLAKDPIFAAMPVHPSVLPVVERMLDRDCLLSGMTAIDLGPGEIPQLMHLSLIHI